MRHKILTLVVSAAVCGAYASESLAQKGMGDATGMARRAVKPAIKTLTGKLLAVETGPCENTVGRATVGTHVLLEAPKGKPWNVHLGPAEAVHDVAERLSVGQTLEVHVFRTDNMPKRHYVAQALELDEETIELRDETLRPVWAGGAAWGPGRGRCPGWAGPQGRGPGPGVGPQGRGRGGWGRGYGRGPGRGRGWGAGWGRRGYGRQPNGWGAGW